MKKHNAQFEQQLEQHFIEVHLVDNTGSYTSEVTRQKQQLDDKLAMTHNSQGQISALKHAGDGVNMCRG